MRIGLIARGDNSGLGTQTLEFYRHMHPDKTLLVDIGELNGYKCYPERYTNNTTYVRGIPRKEDIELFLDDLDVVFVAEAPYTYYLYEAARRRRIKVAVQYNYEFFDWIANPDLPRPHMLIAPSLWHYDEVEQWCAENGVEHAYLHCPVDRERLPFIEKKKARIFLHTAGRSAAHDRNGTATVLAASKYLLTPAKIWVHFQGEQGLAHQATQTIGDYTSFLAENGNPSKVVMNTWDYDDYSEVYKDADVLLLPRRYGGNCLPLNEALSTGMPCIMTDISPNNQFLPTEWLLPAERVGEFTPRTKIDIHGTSPQLLAKKIDDLYNMNEQQMIAESQKANRIAQSISWEAMAAQYMKAFEGLCKL